MRVLIAGAAGAIGRPLVAALNAHGHAVAGLTHDPDKADLLSRLGAQPLVADVLDRDATAAAVLDARPHVVVDQLTAFMQPPSPRAPAGTSRSPAATTTGPETGWRTRANRGSRTPRRWLPRPSTR